MAKPKLKTYSVTLKETIIETLHETVRAANDEEAIEKANDLACEYREDGMGGAYGLELVGLTDEDDNDLDIDI